MPRTTSITIGEHMDAFVSDLVASGRYGSTSDVVRSALRLLEREENHQNFLRAAVEAGDKCAESELSLRDIADQIKRKHNV